MKVENVVEVTEFRPMLLACDRWEHRLFVAWFPLPGAWLGSIKS